MCLLTEECVCVGGAGLPNFSLDNIKYEMQDLCTSQRFCAPGLSQALSLVVLIRRTEELRACSRTQIRFHAKQI